MLSKDAMVLIVGVIILAIALTGVVLWEPDEEEQQETLTSYTLKWEENDRIITLDSGQINDRNDVNLETTIDTANLMKVEFSLQWTDDYEGQRRNFSDLFHIDISAPGGTTATFYPGSSDQGWTSPLIVKAVLNEIPSDVTINATDMDPVTAAIENNTTENGRGDWTVNINVDIHRPLWALLRNRNDDYTLTLNYTYYTPLVEELSD
jgi:hypothetical protein